MATVLGCDRANAVYKFYTQHYPGRVLDELRQKIEEQLKQQVIFEAFKNSLVEWHKRVHKRLSNEQHERDHLEIEQVERHAVAQALEEYLFEQRMIKPPHRGKLNVKDCTDVRDCTWSNRRQPSALQPDLSLILPSMQFETKWYFKIDGNDNETDEIDEGKLREALDNLLKETFGDEPFRNTLKGIEPGCIKLTCCSSPAVFTRLLQYFERQGDDAQFAGRKVLLFPTLLHNEFTVSGPSEVIDALVLLPKLDEAAATIAAAFRRKRLRQRMTNLTAHLRRQLSEECDHPNRQHALDCLDYLVKLFQDEVRALRGTAICLMPFTARPAPKVAYASPPTFLWLQTSKSTGQEKRSKWDRLQRDLERVARRGMRNDVCEIAHRVIRDHREELHRAPLDDNANLCLWQRLTIDTIQALSDWPAAMSNIMERRNYDETSPMGAHDLSFNEKKLELNGWHLGDAGASLLALLLNGGELPTSSSSSAAAASNTPSSSHEEHTSSLSLKNNGIGDFGASMLFAACPRALPKLKALELDGNSLGMHAMHALCQAAKREAFANLEMLSLCDNPLACKIDASAAELSNALACMPELTRLLLNRVNLSHNGAATISALLAKDKLPKLERLNLNCNPFGDKGVESLTEALMTRVCPALKIIQLDDVNMSDRGLQNLIELVQGKCVPNIESIYADKNGRISERMREDAMKKVDNNWQVDIEHASVRRGTKRNRTSPDSDFLVCFHDTLVNTLVGSRREVEALRAEARVQKNPTWNEFRDAIKSARIWWYTGLSTELSGLPIFLKDTIQDRESCSMDDVRETSSGEITSVVADAVEHCQLQIVVLNSCCTNQLAEELVGTARVPIVVCWEGLVEDTAARIFGLALASSFKAGRSPDEAFKHAQTAVEATRKGGRQRFGLQKVEGIPDPKRFPLPAGLPKLLKGYTPLSELSGDKASVIQTASKCLRTDEEASDHSSAKGASSSSSVTSLRTQRLLPGDAIAEGDEKEEEDAPAYRSLGSLR